MKLTWLYFTKPVWSIRPWMSVFAQKNQRKMVPCFKASPLHPERPPERLRWKKSRMEHGGGGGCTVARRYRSVSVHHAWQGSTTLQDDLVRIKSKGRIYKKRTAQRKRCRCSWRMEVLFSVCVRENEAEKSTLQFNPRLINSTVPGVRAETSCPHRFFY